MTSGPGRGGDEREAVTARQALLKLVDQPAAGNEAGGRRGDEQLGEQDRGQHRGIIWDKLRGSMAG